MPTKTFAISKDTLLAKTGSTALGGGADPHLPVGYWSGYHFRAALQFALNWTGVTEITSAVLHLKTTGQVHVGFGSSPSCKIDRLTGSFSENSAKGSADGGSGWSTSASNYDDVTSWTTTGEASLSPGTAEGAWKTVDITTIVKAWAPTSIPGGGGATNYGIIIRPTTDGSSSQTTEFYGQESSFDPYIVLTYVSNTAPNAPTLSSPVGGSRVTDITPTLSFVHNDPQGDACASYAVQVATDAAFSGLIVNVSGQTSGISGNNVAYTLGDISAYRGQTLYWRAQTTDPSGLTGAWAAAQSFVVNSLPTVAVSSPASNGLAAITNLDDPQVWTSAGAFAMARFAWAFSDADGDTQSAYQVRIYDDAIKTTLLYDSGKVASTDASHDSTYALILGTGYYWTIEVWDAYDDSSGESGTSAFKVRWGQAIYEYAPTGGVNSSAWDFTADSPATDTQQAFLFATATGAAGVGRSAWAADIGALTPDAYLNVLVRLSTDVAGTQPVLGSMEFSYVGSGVQPDKWTPQATNPGDWVLDPSVRRFGSQAFRCRVSSTSGNRYVYPYRNVAGDDVVVQANTRYTFSAYVKTNAPLASGAALRLMVYPAGSLATALVDGGASGDNSDSSTTDTAASPEGWKRLLLTFTTGSGVTRIRPMVHYRHNGSTSGDVFWVDGTKLEEGGVATAWAPGFVGDPVVLDSGGVAIDASAGGIFRLRGVSGSSEDVVVLGDHGLVFGTAVEVYSPAIGDLSVDGTGSASDTEFSVIGDTGQSVYALTGKVSGDTDARVAVRADATETGIEFGPGNAARDVVLSRLAADSLGLASGDMLSAEVVGAEYTGATAVNIAANTAATLAWGTKVHDTGNTYDSTNKDWTVPTGRSGVYLVVVNINVVNQSFGTGTAGTRTNLVKNGVTAASDFIAPGNGSTNIRGCLVWLGSLVDGDVLTVTGNPIVASADVSITSITLVRLHAGTFIA